MLRPFYDKFNDLFKSYTCKFYLQLYTFYIIMFVYIYYAKLKDTSNSPQKRYLAYNIQLYNRYFGYMLFAKILIKRYMGYAGCKCLSNCKCIHNLILGLFIIIRGYIIIEFMLMTIVNIAQIAVLTRPSVFWYIRSTSVDLTSDIIFWFFQSINFLLVLLFILSIIRYQCKVCCSYGAGKKCCKKSLRPLKVWWTHFICYIVGYDYKTYKHIYSYEIREKKMKDSAIQFQNIHEAAGVNPISTNNEGQCEDCQEMDCPICLDTFTGQVNVI